jgi:hypothetical protein
MDSVTSYETLAIILPADHGLLRVGSLAEREIYFQFVGLPVEGNA